MSSSDEMSHPGWDPTLYAGSARYYAVGRMPYPAALAEAFVTALGLDRTGRLLDVGCGPGSLTLLLAPWFGETIGLDPDPDMITEARRLAAEGVAGQVRFVNLSAEALPADLGEVDVVTFAQSFHWLDRPRVARTVWSMLRPGGVCAHVNATTHQGVDRAAGNPDLAHPPAPHTQITELVRRYLGPVRRAGQRTLPTGTASGEAEIFRAAGFTGPDRFEVPSPVVTRSTDQIVAAVLSLSSAAPHLFGDQLPTFEDDLRRLLGAASPSGLFDEVQRSIAVDLWWRPGAHSSG